MINVPVFMVRFGCACGVEWEEGFPRGTRVEQVEGVRSSVVEVAHGKSHVVVCSRCSKSNIRVLDRRSLDE
jgi:hypothetical protein